MFHFPGQILACTYTIFPYGKSLLVWRISSGSPFPPNHVCTCTSFVPIYSIHFLNGLQFHLSLSLSLSLVLFRSLSLVLYRCLSLSCSLSFSSSRSLSLSLSLVLFLSTLFARNILISFIYSSFCVISSFGYSLQRFCFFK